MSEGNVEAMRAALAEFARGDFSLWEELSDEFEFTTSPEVPDTGTYRGEEARRWLLNWVASFDEMTIDGSEFIDAGDKVVFAIHQRGVPRGSQAAVEGDWWQVSTFRDGELVKAQIFTTKAQALEAAGISA